MPSPLEKAARLAYQALAIQEKAGRCWRAAQQVDAWSDLYDDLLCDCVAYGRAARGHAAKALRRAPGLAVVKQACEACGVDRPK